MTNTKIRFRIKYANVEVCEDVYGKTDMDFVYGWDIDNLANRDFSDFKDLLKAIEDESCLFSTKLCKYSLNHNKLEADVRVNGSNEIPSDSEIKAWENGVLPLYNAHLFCVIGATDSDGNWIPSRYGKG